MLLIILIRLTSTYVTKTMIVIKVTQCSITDNDFESIVVELIKWLTVTIYCQCVTTVQSLR